MLSVSQIVECFLLGAVGAATWDGIVYLVRHRRRR